ncbi:GrpB family protein [Aquimarina agarilytica]|uniref:GrpB family protein n=1 Tax=Aquimarina agarilytica TaxID=1087449 RepID=UPI0002881AEB|nr:GrpB family protein [Aquimarina agarilytica]
MKINIKKYNSDWGKQFAKQKIELSYILQKYSPRIEHIGSTAVPNLSAKPIIDIAIGLNSMQEIDEIIPIMIDSGFIYISAYNSIMPERRFFINLKNKEKFKQEYKDVNQIPDEEFYLNKISNIHFWVVNSQEWTRHIAFREYLKFNEKVRVEYQELKETLGNQNWASGTAYNKAKDTFIKQEEHKAIQWYTKKSY